LIKGRDIIIHLAVKYSGDWNKIYGAIKEKEPASREEIEASLAMVKSQAMTIIDEDYPEALKKIYKPPFVLFYYGEKALWNYDHNILAVIGSRQPSNYGVTMTRSIVTSLVEEHVMIVSGLAKGIDHIAHDTAIQHGGKTIAVLGSGIDRPYPSETKDTYEVMKRQQLVVSEYPGLVEPNKDNFPWRNRIIAGLSEAVFVSEAKKRSGTLITVGYALYLGKDVFVLPHPANVDNSGNRLIRDGAILVESGQDILDELKKTPHEEVLDVAPDPLPKNFI